MSDTPKQVFFQSSNSSTSTLRPRQTRLISFLDDEDLSTADLQDRQQDGAGPSSIASSSTLGRSNSNVLNRKAEKPTQPRPISEANRLIPNAGLWDPWQSISGIASTLLGNDSHAQVKGKDKGAAKAPSWQKNNSTFTTRTAVPKWGRSLENTPRVTVSAAEERQATVQAKKREAMLLADTHEGPDLAGRYKRRGSDADFSKILSTSDSEQDSLVYVHRIQPLDTLAGVMIKYSCQPEIFRRINRLWPNDNIQTRKHVFLPVDACTIRGKRIDNIGANLDLLNSQLENVSLTQEMGSDPNAESPSFQSTAISSPSMHPISLKTSPNASDYRHESWIQLPHFPLPTEILRIPRKTLGYFPPARRKSGPNSPEHSATSTPKSSFDMLRHPPTHAASLNASPVRRPRMQVTRQRSSSSNLSFVDHLKGPGGVGTLRGLRMEAARPGPAEDPLNRKFKEYLPNLNLAPPEEIPRASLTRSTPRASTDSIRSSSSAGLGEVGGAIEGWVRKLGGAKAPRGVLGGRMGDLIELDTHSDSGMGEAEEDGDQTPTLEVGGSSATEEALLNERFPVRGRIRNAYVGKDKGD